MSTLLDEETVILDDLNFEPGCEIFTSGKECGQEATHQMLCNGCGAYCGIVCVGHAIYARCSTRRLQHRVCGAEDALRDLVKVVPL